MNRKNFNFLEFQKCRIYYFYFNYYHRHLILVVSLREQKIPQTGAWLTLTGALAPVDASHRLTQTCNSLSLPIVRV